MSSRREQRRDHPTRPRSGPGRWTADTLPAVARLPVPHGVLLPEPLGFLSPAGPPRRPAGPAVTASSGWGVTTSPCSLSMTKEVPSRRVPLGEVWSSGHFPLWPKLPHIELRPGPQPDRRDWSPESGGPCCLPAQSHPCRGSPPTDAATPTGPWPALVAGLSLTPGTGVVESPATEGRGRRELPGHQAAFSSSRHGWHHAHSPPW